MCVHVCVSEKQSVWVSNALIMSVCMCMCACVCTFVYGVCACVRACVCVTVFVFVCLCDVVCIQVYKHRYCRVYVYVSVWGPISKRYHHMHPIHTTCVRKSLVVLCRQESEEDWCVTISRVDGLTVSQSLLLPGMALALVAIRIHGCACQSQSWSEWVLVFIHRCAWVPIYMQALFF